MTTPPQERYNRISEGFEQRLVATSESQLDAPTPCPDWTVRDLVAHLIGSHRMMLSTIDVALGEVGPNDDLVTGWHEARTAVLEAMGDDAVAARRVDSPFGTMTFAQLVGGLLCGDTLFHTWDLARATGSDETLDAQMCAEQLELMRPVDEAIRAPGFFGDKIDAPAGADSQTELLCFGGRRP